MNPRNSFRKIHHTSTQVIVLSNQYQSFPGKAGDSRSAEKLEALNLPGLDGCRFLDVGCNEGFFCGFAKFAGAAEAVGLDRSAFFVDRARQRFPECSFVLGDWGSLPDGKFDVILLASSLHYADDQEALIASLMERLDRDGTLVLEIGIVSSDKSEWRLVKRGDDERYFPSMAKLGEMLAPYVWKWVGRSVDQSGDPIGRHVVHVNRRRPTAYLLMHPPGYGKTTLSKDLFGNQDVRIVAGDELIRQVAMGARIASPELSRMLVGEFSPFSIDESIKRIFEQGLGAALIELFVEAGGGGDFALDAYIPDANHIDVVEALEAAGYLPVRLEWNRVRRAPLPRHLTVELAGRYLASFQSAGDSRRTVGYLDRVDRSGDESAVRISGWTAATTHGKLPDSFQVVASGISENVHVHARVDRPDVQKSLHLSRSDVGFVLHVKAPAGLGMAEFRDSLRVTARWSSGETCELRRSRAFGRGS